MQPMQVGKASCLMYEEHQARGGDILVLQAPVTMGRSGPFGKLNFKLNCLELALGVISVGVILVCYPILKLGTLMGSVYGVQVAFTVVNLLIVAAHVADISMHTNLLLTLSILGCIVWLVTGALVSFMFVMTVVYRPLVSFLVAGIAALNNAAIHLLDSVRRCRTHRQEGVVYDKPGEDCLVPIDTASEKRDMV